MKRYYRDDHHHHRAPPSCWNRNGRAPVGWSSTSFRGQGPAAALGPTRYSGALTALPPLPGGQAASRWEARAGAPAQGLSQTHTTDRGSHTLSQDYRTKDELDPSAHGCLLEGTKVSARAGLLCPRTKAWSDRQSSFANGSSRSVTLKAGLRARTPNATRTRSQERYPATLALWCRRCLQRRACRFRRDSLTR